MTSERAAEDWLRDFHDRRPGCTRRAFASMRTVDGRSSYDVLADEVRPGERVLDLACGDGFLLEKVVARGGQGIGVDLSAGELAEAARRVPRASLHEARAQALPLPDDHVDLVLCHMALMLMRPLDEALAEARRVLRAGGRFAAIVSGAPRGGWATFVGQLRNLPLRPQVRLGDPRARDPRALAALLGATIEPVELEFEADTDGLWALFDETYDRAMLAPEAAALLRESVREVLPDHPVACGIRLWMVRANW